jgi:acyl carrier protein
MASPVVDRVHSVIRDVFKNPSLALTDATRAGDVKGWDSLGHINLVLALEKEFGVKLRPAQMARLKNVGELVAHMSEKASG